MQGFQDLAVLRFLGREYKARKESTEEAVAG